MREIFFSNINNKVYGMINKNEWYHISDPNDLENLNNKLQK